MYSRLRNLESPGTEEQSKTQVSEPYFASVIESWLCGVDVSKIILERKAGALILKDYYHHSKEFDN